MKLCFKIALRNIVDFNYFLEHGINLILAEIMRKLIAFCVLFVQECMNLFVVTTCHLGDMKFDSID